MLPFALVLVLFLDPAAPVTNSFVVFPADCNGQNTLFGGKILSEMDRTAAIVVRRTIAGTEATGAVTIAINDMKFAKAAYQKDLVLITATVKEIGRKTVTVYVKVERENLDTTKDLLAEGIFVFCAVKDGKSVEIQK